MIVTSDVERIPTSSGTGFGVKVTFTYTSFNEKEIDIIEEELKLITNTYVEVNTNEMHNNRS